MWDFIVNWFKGLWPKEEAPAPSQTITAGLQANLSWELESNDGQVNQKAQPARRDAWSLPLFSEAKAHWDVIGTASDLPDFIGPRYQSLTVDQRITCFCELMSTVAEYESSWNPAAYDSKAANGDTSQDAVPNGLFQMGVRDQINYKTGTSYTYKELRTAIPNIKTAVMIVNNLVKIRGKIMFNKEDRSPILGYFFQTLIKDIPYGAKTISVAKKRIDAIKFEEPKPYEKTEEIPTVVAKPAWKAEAEKHKGQVETNATFSEWLRTKIKTYLGYKPPTIATSTYAWCGYFIVTVLGVSGYQYHKQGEMARNWGSYGNEIKWQSQGVPEGAIVWINHGYDCKSSSSNHVALANGSCTVKDFFDASGKLKPSATIALLGGNQNNQVNVTAYLAKEICGVRWPAKDKDGKNVPQPTLPVLKSVNCTTTKTGGSTQ